MNKIHAFMIRHLRLIMKIKWQDKMTNIEVLKQPGLPSMENLLIRNNLCWTPFEDANYSRSYHNDNDHVSARKT